GLIAVRSTVPRATTRSTPKARGMSKPYRSESRRASFARKTKVIVSWRCHARHLGAVRAYRRQDAEFRPADPNRQAPPTRTGLDGAPSVLQPLPSHPDEEPAPETAAAPEVQAEPAEAPEVDPVDVLVPVATAEAPAPPLRTEPLDEVPP